MAVLVYLKLQLHCRVDAVAQVSTFKITTTKKGNKLKYYEGNASQHRKQTGFSLALLQPVSFVINVYLKLR